MPTDHQQKGNGNKQKKGKESNTIWVAETTNDQVSDKIQLLRSTGKENEDKKTKNKNDLTYNKEQKCL